MFDWPEHSQTSPTRMLFTVTVLVPAMVIVCGPPAVMAGSCTLHFPLSQAVAVTLVSPSVTVTFVPGSSQPQIGTASPRCRTMLSPMTDGSLTAAGAADTHATTANRTSQPTLRTLMTFFSLLKLLKNQKVEGRKKHGRFRSTNTIASWKTRSKDGEEALLPSASLFGRQARAREIRAACSPEAPSCLNQWMAKIREFADEKEIDTAQTEFMHLKIDHVPPGDRVFKFEASDGTSTVSDEQTVPIYPPNSAPVITAAKATPAILAPPGDKTSLSAATRN